MAFRYVVPITGYRNTQDEVWANRGVLMNSAFELKLTPDQARSLWPLMRIEPPLTDDERGLIQRLWQLVNNAAEGSAKDAAMAKLTSALDAAGARSQSAVDAIAADRARTIRSMLTAEQLATFHAMLVQRRILGQAVPPAQAASPVAATSRP